MLKFAKAELDDKLTYLMFKQKEEDNIKAELAEDNNRIANLTRINLEFVEGLRFIHNEFQEAKGNIRVFCRVRKDSNINNNKYRYIEYPSFNTIELNSQPQKSNTGGNKDISFKEQYKFDMVFKPENTQDDVFKEISQLVTSALDGYKVCIFAYGQTGSGKTYTMQGEEGEQRGIIPRSVEQIFYVKSQMEKNNWKFNIEVSYIEIYLDQIRDLLLTSNNIVTKEKPASAVEVFSTEDLNNMFQTATKRRKVAETLCNEKSSRSHSIFQLKINAYDIDSNQERNGALNLIDLAGSERISKSKVEDDRKKETISINKSLTALKSVITALVNNNSKSSSHIPYRDSLLTHYLQNSLGGDSKTLMFVNISPLTANYSESSNSLKFASDVNLCTLTKNN
jgi:kinesin family protein C1